VLVTNAHQHALELKKSVAGLDKWFDEFVCSHDFGVPKEHQEFWRQLEACLGFERDNTLFVDDSIPVLNAAVKYGLGGVVAIRHPDTGQPAKDTEGHHAVDGVGSWTNGKPVSDTKAKL
jgi:FMN phosphatase YigB (HAD superfamily)